MRMRKLTLPFALLVCFAFGPILEACQKCRQYYDYQALAWCWYCDSTNCGLFTCDVRQDPTVGDYCDGEEGCFVTRTGRHCAFAPTEHGTKCTPPDRLDRTWKFAGVRVSHPGRTIMAARRTPVIVQ